MDSATPTTEQAPDKQGRRRGRLAILGVATCQGLLAGVAVGNAMVLVGSAATSDWNGYDIVVTFAFIVGAFIGACAGLLVGLGLLLVGPDRSPLVQRLTAGAVAMASATALWLTITTDPWRPFGWWAVAGIGAAGVIAAWRVPSILRSRSR